MTTEPKAGSPNWNALLTMYETGYDVAMETWRIRREAERLPGPVFLLSHLAVILLGCFAFAGIMPLLHGDVKLVFPVAAHIAAGVASVVWFWAAHKHQRKIDIRREQEAEDAISRMYIDEFERTVAKVRDEVVLD